MKAGIVSLYGNVNYGNKLQSYAVQEVIKRYGYQTRVIYVQSNKEYIKQLIVSLMHITSIRHYSLESSLLFRRRNAFKKFSKKYICEKRYSSIEAIRNYDIYVVGSDQVWNPQFLNTVNKELFFLTFATSDQKVCFSPSFGIDYIPEQWLKFYQEQLCTFSNISVREESGKQMVETLTGKEAKVLIDPTMMLNKDEWLKIAKKPHTIDTDNAYLITYFLGGIPQEAQKDILEANKTVKGKVYKIMDISNPELYVCDPSEFIYLLNNASLVLTDSFHACVFSFLLGKPFLVYERQGKRSDMFTRIYTLLNTFDLYRKYTKSGLSNEIFEADYQMGYEILEKERKKVLDYLDKSLLV